MNCNVSVILTVHNKYSIYLRKSMLSVIQQRLVPKELIVVDDSLNNENSCYNIFCEIISENINSNINFIYLNSPTNNIQINRRKGVERAISDYILFLDADDFLTIKYFNLSNFLVESGKFDVIYSDCYYIYEDGTIKIREIDNFKLRNIKNGNFIPITAIIKKSTLLKCNVFDSRIRILEDWNLWLSLNEVNANFFRIPIPIWFIFCHKNSTSNNDYLKDSLKIISEKHKGIKHENL